MKVFKPWPDGNPQMAHPMDVSDFEYIKCSLEQADPLDGWSPPRMNLVTRESNGERLSYADSPWFGVSLIVLRVNAAISLGPEMHEIFHFLPFLCDDTELVGLTPKLMISGALNLDASEVQRLVPSQTIFKVNKHVFEPMAIGAVPAFKISELRSSPIYVTDTFVNKWLTCGLVGIEFEKIWEM